MYEKVLEYKNTDPNIINNLGYLGVFTDIDNLTVAEKYTPEISQVATAILETYFENET